MLPDPIERPLLTVDDLVQLVPTLGRSAAYEAVRRGEIPSITYGRKVFVVTALLRKQWGLDASPDMDAAALTGAADVTATTTDLRRARHDRTECASVSPLRPA